MTRTLIVDLPTRCVEVCGGVWRWVEVVELDGGGQRWMEVDGVRAGLES
jgi:hypothetical protein